MSDGIKRDPARVQFEDRWQGRTSGTTSAERNAVLTIPVRVLPWPTAADGDGPGWSDDLYRYLRRELHQETDHD